MAVAYHIKKIIFFKKIIVCIVFLMLTMVASKAQWYTDPNAPKASSSTSSSSNSTYGAPGSPGGGGTVGGGTTDPDPAVPIDGGVSI